MRLVALHQCIPAIDLVCRRLGFEFRLLEIRVTAQAGRAKQLLALQIGFLRLILSLFVLHVVLGDEQIGTRFIQLRLHGSIVKTAQEFAGLHAPAFFRHELLHSSFALRTHIDFVFYAEHTQDVLGAAQRVCIRRPGARGCARVRCRGRRRCRSRLASTAYGGQRKAGRQNPNATSHIRPSFALIRYSRQPDPQFFPNPAGRRTQESIANRIPSRAEPAAGREDSGAPRHSIFRQAA